MIKNTIFSLVIATAGFALLGCEDSDKEDVVVIEEQEHEAKTLTVTGKAIDGYIVGGTVFLDINGNGLLDEGEPEKLTEEAGDYSLDVPEADAACLAYSAIIVDVPAGAWDEGSEDEGVEAHEVTEPYQIVLQPTFEPITEEDFTNGLVRNVSPLTTVVWQAIERDYPRKIEEKHCDYLKEHSDAVVALQQEIATTVNGLVSFYNISADQMFADFIADKDSEAFHTAQDIMKGLKAAYKRKSEIRENYPNAEIRVSVFRSKDNDQSLNVENGWYRHELIYAEDESFIEDTKLKDTASLDEIDFIITKLYSTGQPWNDQSKKGWLSVRTDAYRNDSGQYRCAKNERVSFTVNEIEYELYNGSDSGSLADSFESCNFDDFSSPYERSYDISYKTNDVRYSAQFYFREQQSRFTDLEDWHSFTTNSEFDPDVMINALSVMPYQWDEDVNIDTAYWRKRKEDENIMIETDDENNWVKTTSNEDGTKSEECSSDGVNWGVCNG